MIDSVAMLPIIRVGGRSGGEDGTGLGEEREGVGARSQD